MRRSIALSLLALGTSLVLAAACAGKKGGAANLAGDPGGPFFPAGAVWYQDVSAAPIDAESSARIGWLASNGGFGLGHIQVDFSIEVLATATNGSTPFRTFTTTSDFYTPDCDAVPFPVPVGGAIEGEDGYHCARGGDCHLLVADRLNAKLYEMWRADISGGTFSGGCVAVWDMTRVYPDNGRGDQCTSADAAGYPIAPLLFTADEVAAGHIDHAIRFVLPNDRIDATAYAHPATHGAGTGPGAGILYGSRFRLRADYPLDALPNDAARTVARAMQKYGMFLADGGNVALTARSDRSTAHKWDGLLAPNDLVNIHVRDFEIVDGGTHVPLTDNCVRNP